MKRTAIAYDPFNRRHTREGHPENFRRLDETWKLLQIDGILNRMTLVPSTPAPLDAVLRVHSSAYLDRLETSTIFGGGHLDADTLTVDKPLARDPNDRLRVAVRPEGRQARTDFTRLARFASVDLRKDPQLMESAYNDLAGVTARFNRNALSHLNHRFDATFDMYAFRHDARWLEAERCIEMRLISQGEQSARLGGETIEFQRGEPLVTARAYKYTPSELAELACEAGLTVERSWMDEAWRFGLFWLSPEQR